MALMRSRPISVCAPRRSSERIGFPATHHVSSCSQQLAGNPCELRIGGARSGARWQLFPSENRHGHFRNPYNLLRVNTVLFNAVFQEAI